MEIRVRRANRSMYRLEVESTETVESLKAKIEEKEGIPSSQQRLMKMGVRLQNENTLKHYNIKHNQCISLAWIERGEMQILIKHQNGSLLLEVDESQSVATTITKIKDRLRIPSYMKKSLVFDNVVLEDEKTVSSYKDIDLSLVKLVDG
ncbi:hypothetical protein SUGI_1473830 [Cryptomeria japonica]|uniref:Ubiquitin-like domain-containing protein n=1 Tax=Cryptomeria japonica TaxID=3369 RepID=A0AAD3RRC8_CRYJA|nr:ubiquitin-like [Cryptomeria japonica]XP_059072019.1 ubiquitin-like [Cryptomeria japonica]GLJ58749.1 hypothetical protein SUGI_1473820 [Cryptomeria japonica]GLJ58750.1 hypothetical protein SUGI_1473830 [Cryptomeria japonica]